MADSRRGTALLVIDMQEHFRGGGLAESILGELNLTIDVCRALGMPVLFTQHGHPLQGTPEAEAEQERGSVLLKWWGPEHALRVGTRSWQLMDGIHWLPADPRILKSTYDCFYKTPLLQVLRQLQVHRLAIGGVVTNCCCETTARSAFVRNFEVLFLGDGTAAHSREMQEASLLNIAFCCGRVLTCRQLRAELGMGGRP